MSLERLLSAQELAGKRYQIAVNMLYEAYVELASIDAALACSNVNQHRLDVRTFSPLAADLRPFDHPQFAPLKVPGDWRETIAQRRD